MADALDGWTRSVFPVCAAMAPPGNDLARRADPHMIVGGDRAADAFRGPPTVRDFGGLGEVLRRAAAERPPTMVVVQEVFIGYALPERPVRLSTYCARVADGPTTEVTILDGDSGDASPRIAGHLPWDRHGSLGSWGPGRPARVPSRASVTSGRDRPRCGRRV